MPFTILAICGLCGFALVASTALHELGHAGAMLAAGGSVRQIIVSPFAWSRCIPGGDFSPSFTYWAGLLCGPLVACGLCAILRRGRGAASALAFFLAAYACLDNGTYLITDSLWDQGGDASMLMAEGTSKTLTIAVGALLVAVAAGLSVRCANVVGIRPCDSVARRLLVLAAGTAPFVLGGAAWGIWCAQDDTGEILRTLSWDVGEIVALALVTTLAQRTFLRPAGDQKVAWHSVGAANGAMCAAWALVLGLQGSTLLPHSDVSYLITDFDPAHGYIGVKVVGTTDLAAAPERVFRFESTVFWRWEESEGRLELPTSVWQAVMRRDGREIVICGMEGIVLCATDGVVSRRLNGGDGTLVVRSFVDTMGARAVLECIGVGDEGWSLLAIDVATFSATKFPVPKPVGKVAFVDGELAVASIGEDRLEIRFSPGGNHRFAIVSGASREGIVDTMSRGEFVLRPDLTHEEEPTQEYVLWGRVRRAVEAPVHAVLSSGDALWVIAGETQVLEWPAPDADMAIRLKEDARLIGYGVCGERIWVAFEDGRVLTIDREVHAYSVPLPPRE